MVCTFNAKSLYLYPAYPCSNYSSCVGLYVWQPASLFQQKSNNAAFTKYIMNMGHVGVSKQKSIVPNQDGWHQYSYSNFTSLTVAHFAHSYPMKTVCILLKWEFHRDAASNNPTNKKHFSKETPPATDVFVLLHFKWNGTEKMQSVVHRGPLNKTVWGKDDVT